MRGATLFSGGGGVEAHLQSRINFVHAVEYDPAIAAVYARNIGPHITVADVRHVDYTTWGQLDYLHASPVCKNASQAKTDGEESDTDIETAMAVVRCLETTEPSVFTLENVWGYRTFEAFRRICQALDRGGYMWHFEHLNAADFGVPQTRRRLILRASRGLLPTLPPAVPWVGWYAAIEDLIPTLPESAFAPWQLERLPEGLCRSARAPIGTESDIRNEDEPAHTTTSAHYKNMPKAFVISNSKTEFSDGIRDAGDPMLSVTTQTGPRARAFIVEGDTAGDRAVGVPHADSPVMTVKANVKGGMRAWLVNGDNSSRDLTMRDEAEPCWTVQSSTAKAPARAWLAHGRVVKMTPRALARFQSLPDSYELPSKASLACTVIGNMVPSLMMEKIVEQLI